MNRGDRQSTDRSERGTNDTFAAGLRGKMRSLVGASSRPGSVNLDDAAYDASARGSQRTDVPRGAAPYDIALAPHDAYSPRGSFDAAAPHPVATEQVHGAPASHGVATGAHLAPVRTGSASPSPTRRMSLMRSPAHVVAAPERGAATRRRSDVTHEPRGGRAVEQRPPHVVLARPSASASLDRWRRARRGQRTRRAAAQPGAPHVVHAGFEWGGAGGVADRVAGRGAPRGGCRSCRRCGGRRAVMAVAQAVGGRWESPGEQLHRRLGALGA